MWNSLQLIFTSAIKGRLGPQIWMNFWKNSKRSFTLRFPPEIHDQITVYNSKNLQRNFLDQKCTPPIIITMDITGSQDTLGGSTRAPVSTLQDLLGEYQVDTIVNSQ